MWISLPFLLLFVQGYLYIFVLSILPKLRGAGARLRVARSGGLP